ncbi:MAG: ComF family protein [Candidatus Aminicenantes bacterium]|nr:MAG: ComF family protein [Candidatus Aminicenantes bacterium]
MRFFLQTKFGTYLKLAELIFFPSECELCSRLLELPDERIICRTCLQGLKPRRTSFCLCCGKFFDDAGEPHFCSQCVLQKPVFSVHRSCGPYFGSLKDTIILFKYRGFHVLDKALATFVLQSLGREESLWWGVDSIIPVPLFPEKQKKRGFNQASELARELARQKNIDLIENQLIKVKKTPPQTSLEASERRKNLKEAFAVIRDQGIKDKTILLVDDVYTTGSTLQECSLALMKAGALEVRALTIAQA